MALIGFISDSHGEWLRTRNAVKLLCDRGCTTLIHLGDVETHEVLDELAGHNVTLVFGNCDSVVRLSDYAVDLGIDVQHPSGTITSDGMCIAFLHGHDEAQYHRFLDDKRVDVVAHGHSHETRDEMINNTRCINPGALHRAARYTVAVLDTEKDVLEFLELEMHDVCRQSK
jgi:putative phosphoesterase